ncbi:tRNA (adenosine(37)-N6)-threonylcarbamoyltransferase complex ATPase subunit type 1 TsaE [Aeromicrobium phragmitis]|uniref:tRNA threonylcarbamoyladenosine biosynthesis protein TsaE n=1 Tax=Aeromicrobium phragmitis TaxID=2478914 RepID=A0A3L8PQ20_9ACTN|nr:tRNA (adenosine(37)-N6)-threonylcarbamoyltransferase complex ATPase subunit type 1 TsaE [Aeromicrobium phragmitis]RLV56538.1 tRNA (adenosine(37)-N6)-threonylcarbamoyltransferase complex ATPase subunit type 1 TsaE [Aeromicrobium phragmitis]
MTALDVIEAGPEHAAAVVEVIHRSFAARPPLDPPTTAFDETEDTVAAVLRTSGGLLAMRRDRPIGAILFDESRPGTLGLRRVSVHPQGRDRGVASAMVGVAEDIAEERGKDGIWLDVREELPDTVRFWTRKLYQPVARTGTMIHMAKTLWLSREVPDVDAMHALAGKLVTLLRAGDLLVLSGDLGAGKTTFTQGLGEALGVRGPITSPTFVIARNHPSLTGGPGLVHVDAYRLSDPAEIDDLDLDATTEESITVVEWGEGRAEQLADSWLSVTIEARDADDSDPLGTAVGVESPDMRVVTIRPRGPRWVGVPLRSTLLA